MNPDPWDWDGPTMYHLIRRRGLEIPSRVTVWVATSCLSVRTSGTLWSEQLLPWRPKFNGDKSPALCFVGTCQAVENTPCPHTLS